MIRPTANSAWSNSCTVMLYSWPQRTIAASIKNEGINRNDNSIFFSWRESLKDTVIDIAEKRSESGWDGYDALPISRDAVMLTLNLIDKLPEAIDGLEISPVASGLLCLDWQKEDKVFSIEVDKKEISYSFIKFSGHKKKLGGLEEFTGRIPDEISRILSDNFCNNERL